MTNGEFFAELEKLGAAEVGARLVTKVFLGANAHLAQAWLERRNEDFNSEQAATAVRAADAAEAAAREAALANKMAATSNKIAIIALVMAIISIVASLIGIFHKP
jgi:membrane protein required for beta-lactamase induction